jgi:hypothetical protein
MKETLHKPVHTVGPLLPPGYGEDHTSPAITSKDVEIESFLNLMRSRYGDKAVLFVRNAVHLELYDPIQNFLDFIWHHILGPRSRLNWEIL